MEVKEQIISDIQEHIKHCSPSMSEEQKSRMYKIINPDIEDYMIYGVKTSTIEKIVKQIQTTYSPSYDKAKEIFKILAKTNVEEYKFVAFFLINRYKKHFTAEIVSLFRNHYFPFCHTWSTCDSCCIRVIGPFLARKNNAQLARKTIDDWNQNNFLWIKRASLVLLLKIIMLNKNFDEKYVFEKVEQSLSYSHENYIAKGIGWLLKTCSKYQPEIIVQYLIENRKKLSRLIVRYASEKLPKEQRQLIMEK